MSRWQAIRAHLRQGTPSLLSRHWWTFWAVVPGLVALDHGLRWWAEGQRASHDAWLAVAHTLREESWLTDFFPGSHILPVLLATVAVGVLLWCHHCARHQSALARLALHLVSAGAVGYWLDRVLFSAATVPLRVACFGAAKVFSLGDVYLGLGLFFFSVAALKSTTARPEGTGRP